MRITKTSTLSALKTQNDLSGQSLNQTSGNFSQVLANVQRPMSFSTPPTSRWSSLSFLTTANAPKTQYPWTRSALDQLLNTTVPTNQSAFFSLPATRQSASIAPTAKVAATIPGQPMSLAQYPRPIGDNGRGIHWIPTLSQSPDVVDRYVSQASAMGMKWVVFLNDGDNIGANDYLVRKLTEAGIEPVMRIYTSGITPINGDIKSMVKHYKSMGVDYFQVYNEPNLRVETGGKPADVDEYVRLWSDVAKDVIEGGGLPGFGALSPQGEMDDREFLRQSLQKLIDSGHGNLLNKGWLAMHNYTGPRALSDPDGFLRFKQYEDIIQQVLGRPLPIVGTEGGTHVSPLVSPKQQIQMVTGAYQYMAHREDYNFAYTYWIIANGHDPAWNEHALFRNDAPTPLAQALLDMNTGGMA